MPSEGKNPVVHLELQTDNLPRACAIYTALFPWRAETVRAGSGSYLSLDLGIGIDAGVSERPVDRPTWLPYVEVRDVSMSADRACGLGGHVLLSPREGPEGWRSVVSTPDGGEVAFWQPKSGR